MKVVHICISGPYVDGWGYQENLLPEYMTYLGAESHVVASANDFPDYLSEEAGRAIVEKGLHYSYNGVSVHRIKTWRFTSSLFAAPSLYKTLKFLKPDVIYHHNVNCTTLLTCGAYAKKFKVTLVADNHADVLNMSKNNLWSAIYYKFLCRVSCRFISGNLKFLYGVSIGRCQFARYFFRVDDSKIKFLPIGADTKTADNIGEKEFLRAKYGIHDGELVVVSGGKMDVSKGTGELIEAVRSLRRDFPDVRLFLFGSINDEFTKGLVESSSFVTYKGWCDRMTTLELLKMADVACWPVHHTTLVEDSVSVGTPLILKKTVTTAHLIDGNGIWLSGSDRHTIFAVLKSFISQTEEQRDVMSDGCIAMRKRLDYYTIAKTVIEDVS